MATKQEIKERGIRLGINQIVTYAGLVPIFWFIVQPIIVDALAEEMQEKIKQTVAAEVAPINNAFVALLQREINVTRKDIAALEFRERQADDWTSEDAAYLADLEIQLDALEEAKAFLQADNTS
jgi:sensor domain CHASE-containing protein